MALKRWAMAALLAAGCGGGGGEGDQSGCRGECLFAGASLSAADVERVVRQAVHEAQAQGVAATVAVVDRVGNVLAVFRMTGAAATTTIASGRAATGGLENTAVPAELAAISKAVTGAFLSSEGHAFSTRTASQIVQEHFNPREANAPSGPLFGVQFSSLACSDVARVSAAVAAGPKASPLGLAADPGGLPLYKGGALVGGVGIVAIGTYGIDLDIFDVDFDPDEVVAVAAASGFDAPTNRRAERITADGRTLRFVDRDSIASSPAAAPAFAALPGALVAVPGFFAPAAVRAGTVYGTTASGYRPDATNFPGLFVLDDGSGAVRFAPQAGSDGLLTQAEVTRILAEAARVASRTRAQIRRPVGSSAQVSVTVIDTNGAILGLVRTPDAPVFSTDVAVQKARGALLFSHPAGAADLAALPASAPYAAALEALLPGALTSPTAFSTRAIGNLARPLLPDGIDGSPQGPLSKPLGQWSPFNTGLSLDLVFNSLANGTSPCTGLARAPNGIQIFPGGFPIYRGATLVGAIGVSGDGVDQDDLVGFLGLANAGAALGTGIAHAPVGLRADRFSPAGGRLRYVGCPVAPFLDSATSDACAGL